MKIYHTTGSIIQRTAWLPLRVFFAYFLRLHVQGIDHVKKLSTNVIFASNHANELDPLIIVSCLPFFSRHLPLVFVSREKSFYAHIGWKSIFYGGKLFTLMGAFQAYSGLKDFHKALPHHLAALSVGRSVCIFPMGKKHLDTNLENAKGGVTFLAQETGLPIIPVRIIGAENITLRDFFLRQ